MLYQGIIIENQAINIHRQELMDLYSYPYPRPSVSVDLVILRKIEGEYQLLLIKRAQDPFAGKYTLPGGFVNIDESLEKAAARELLEETGLTLEDITQVHTFSAVDRDPRDRVITTAFLGIITSEDIQPVAGSDATFAAWFSLENLPALAFDHAEIIQATIEKMDLPDIFST